jgi:dihydropteroate synthase
VAAGADILDIGAESTRPGATLLTAEQEWQRLAPVLLPLSAAQLPVVLSLDTRHPEIADRASELGVKLLNLAFPQHFFAAAGFSAQADPLCRARLVQQLLRFDGIVFMHSRGDPATMGTLTDYPGDLCQTVVTELQQTIAPLLPSADCTGLRKRLIFDPGLCFAKTAAQSRLLLARLRWLRHALGGKLLIGASRKSMLGAMTGLAVNERLLPSVVAAALAAYQGADVVRVHDVAETVIALRLADGLRHAGEAA